MFWVGVLHITYQPLQTLYPSNKLNMKTNNKTCEVSNFIRFNCNAMLFEPIGQKRNAMAIFF
jgi:hypothetical protein